MNKLFIWHGVMNGCYTPGMACAVAQSKEEAIDLLITKLENGTSKFTGTWLSFVGHPETNQELVALFKDELTQQPCQEVDMTTPFAFFNGGGD
jgi:hypothetical protein